MKVFVRLLDGVLWLEPFWIALVAPSLLLPDLFWDPWVQPWLIVALFAFWPLRLLYTHRLAAPSPLNWPVWALLLWLPVGLWGALNPAQAWYQAGLLAMGIALYFALVNWPPAQRRPWLVALLIGSSGLLLTALGPELLLRVPTDFILFSEEVTQSKPLNLWGTGETMNPNVLAGGLLLPIPLIVALAVRTSWARRRWWPPLLLLVALPIVIVLILAQSRGGYLALFIALLVVLTLRWRWFGVAAAIALVTTSAIISWEGTLLFAEAFGSDGSVTSFSGRLDIWQGTLAVLRTSPLLGLGFANFELVMPAYIVNWKFHVPHAHNLLLQIAVDLGVPGVCFYLWLLYQSFRTVLYVVRSDGYESKPAATENARHTDSQRRMPSSPAVVEEKPKLNRRERQRIQVHARRCASLRWSLAVGLGGAMVAMLIHGLVDAVVWDTKLAFLPWLFFALASLLWQQPPCDELLQRAEYV